MIGQKDSWGWDKTLLRSLGKIFVVRVIGEGANQENFQEVAKSGVAVKCRYIFVIFRNNLTLVVFVIVFVEHFSCLNPPVRLTYN